MFGAYGQETGGMVQCIGMEKKGAVPRRNGVKMEQRKMKKVSDSRVEQIYKIRPEHMNGAGRLFGGRLMEWIDEVAGLVGIRHAQTEVLTASLYSFKFIKWSRKNDIIVLIGRMTYVGNSSMEVRVDTYKESMDGIRKPINRAYLTLVAVDGEGKPVMVPGLIIGSEAERAEWEAGMRRREIRKQRKEEGF